MLLTHSHMMMMSEFSARQNIYCPVYRRGGSSNLQKDYCWLAACMVFFENLSEIRDATRQDYVVNQLIDYQFLVNLIDYLLQLSYQFNYCSLLNPREEEIGSPHTTNKN
jgi:hypothetical protein